MDRGTAQSQHSHSIATAQSQHSHSPPSHSPTHLQIRCCAPINACHACYARVWFFFSFFPGFLSDPSLSAGLLKDTKFSMYQVQGTNPFFGNWSQTRSILTPMANHQTGNPSYYSKCPLTDPVKSP